jgi:hypothetical protein
VQWPESVVSNPGTVVPLSSQFFSAAAATPQMVTVQLKNAFGAVLSGVSVSFVVTSGGGSVSVATVNTDASGNASTSWTLAGSSGTVGTVEARVTGVPTLVFTGTVQ